MTPNNWQTIFQYISYLGAFIVLVSTIGIWHFTKQVDKEKDNKIDELVAGNNKLLSHSEDIIKKLDMLVATGKMSKEVAQELKSVVIAERVSIKDKVDVKILPPNNPSSGQTNGKASETPSPTGPKNKSNEDTSQSGNSVGIGDKLEIKVIRGKDKGMD